MAAKIEALGGKTNAGDPAIDLQHLIVEDPEAANGTTGVGSTTLGRRGPSDLEAPSGLKIVTRRSCAAAASAKITKFVSPIDFEEVRGDA